MINWSRHVQCDGCEYCDVFIEEVGMNDNGYIFTDLNYVCDNGCECDSDEFCEECILRQ